MRRLISRFTRRRRERGVSSIAIGIMAPLLIAGAGIGIDAGNLALEANRVQKAADSAALAVGQDCAAASRPDATTAEKNKCTPAAAQATAQAMANANTNGSTPVLANVSSGSTGLTVTITKDVAMPLGSAVGVGDKDVAATAKVAWNFIPVAARTFPLAMSVCDYYDWKASSNKTQKKLYRYDLYQSSLGLPSLFGDSCTDPATNRTISTAGGAMWLPSLGSLIGGECNVDTRLGNILTGSIISTGLTIPSDCLRRARDITPGEIYLVPIYQTTNVLGLNINVSATIKGYAPFKITGYRVGSTIGGLFNPLDPAVYNDTSAPACSVGFLINRCFGIQGYFTGNVGSMEGVLEWGNPVGGVDLGVVLAKLVS